LCGVGTSEFIPREAIFPAVLETVQVAAARGEVARPPAPRTAVGVCVDQAFNVALVRGLVARRSLPHVRRVPRDADGAGELHAVDVSVEGCHLAYVVDQTVFGVNFGKHEPPMPTRLKTIGVRVKLYYVQ